MAGVSATRWATLGLAVLVVAGGVLLGILIIGDGDDAEPPPPPSNASTQAACETDPSALPSPEPGEPQVQAVCQDAGLGFEYLGTQCGFENVIAPGGRLSAEGQYCLTDFVLVNTTGAPLAIDPRCQVIVDEAGGRYTASVDESELLVPDDSPDIFGVGLSGGARFEDGGLIFDIPADVEA
ncbi:MAG: hypothetical protein ACRDHK_15635, partial [Actinomycetota bacterium]